MAKAAIPGRAPRASRLDRRKARTRQALSAVAGGLLGLLRLRQRHPERLDEASVDQLAEAILRMLGVPAAEATRVAALDLPGIEAW